MANDFVLNLGVAACGLAAGTAVAVGFLGAWRHRADVVVGAIVVAVSTTFLGLRLAAPEPGSMSPANSSRPWLVVVGAGSALVCAGLVAVWRWRRTRVSAVLTLTLGAFVLYLLVYGGVAYVSHIG